MWGHRTSSVYDPAPLGLEGNSASRHPLPRLITILQVLAWVQFFILNSSFNHRSCMWHAVFVFFQMGFSISCSTDPIRLEYSGMLFMFFGIFTPSDCI